MKVDLRDEKTVLLLKRVVREAVRPYLGYLLLSGLFMTIVAVSTAGTAWLLDPVVDEVFVEQSQEMLWWIALAVVGVFFSKSAAAYAQETLIAYVGQRVVADLQQRLHAHILDQDVAIFQEKHTGTLISHFTYDINAMRTAVAQALVGLGRDTLSVIFLCAVMIYQEWSLALIMMVVGPLAAYPMQVLGRRMRRVSAETQDAMAGLTKSLSQSFQGIRMIKAYCLEEMERGRVGGLVSQLFQLTFRAARVRAISQPIIDFLGGLAIAAVIVYGGTRVIEGATTPGQFFSFIAAALMAYQPLRALAKVNASLQEGLAAAQRIFAVLDQPPAVVEPKEPTAVPAVAGAVRLEGVRFSYDDVKSALTGIDLEAPAGKVTALVGPSGAGKSTVLGLIPRFFDPTEGTVRVNGVDARVASTLDLRSRIALVSQEIVLFDDTVMANIRFGRMDASEEDVHAAAKAAAAHDFIAELPEGYDTLIGEQGVKLSGGQRQRIAIARAILRDAPILLLDEATSALDTESERKIQTALDHLMVGRTTIVIAHRLSTIVHADLIHVLDQGQVAESGTHTELLARGGLYAKLHRLQFGDEGMARAG